MWVVIKDVMKYFLNFDWIVLYYQTDLFYNILQYLNDVEELENWINDKMALATSKDYGKDENSADKLLTKNKVWGHDLYPRISMQFMNCKEI